MPAIVTLTLNPALDLSTSASKVEPQHKLRCAAAQEHPGGGGINVARVLFRLGADVLALFPAGGPSGQRLRRALDGEGVASEVVSIQGETRESFTVHETSTGQDWRFVLPGPTLAPAEWQACLDRALLRAPAWLVASGSLPPGVPDDAYARLASAAAAKGTRLVLDTSGPALAAALSAGVEVVKPSLRELQAWSGLALDTPSERLRACRELLASGHSQAVALSLGADGALIVSAEGAWEAPGLDVPVASTIGAGDSFVGGLVWALAAGQPLAEAFRFAMAASAAALLEQGTSLCQAADVHRLLPSVRVRPC